MTRTRGAVALLMILGMVNFSDKAIIGLAAGSIRVQYHLTSVQWGVVGSSFYALFSIASLALPFYALKRGTKPLLGLLAVIWAGVQFLTIVPVSNFFYLVGTRIILGASEGPFYALAVHLAAVWTPSSHRGFTFGALTLGSAIGPALLSPGLALLIVQFGWRGAFFVLGVIGFLWCIVWWWWSRSLPETPIQEAPVEKKVRTDPSLVSRLAQPRILFTILSGFGGYWYLAILVIWVPQYFSDVRHLSQSSVPYILAVSLPWLGGAVVQFLVSLLSDWLWRKTSNIRLARILPLASCLGIGAVLIALLTVVSTPWAIVCLSLSPLGASFSLVAVLLGEMVPESSRGQMQGIGVALYSLAGLIAPAVTGLIIQRVATESSGFAMAFLVGAILIGCLGVLCWIYVRSLPILIDPVSLEMQSSPVV